MFEGLLQPTHLLVILVAGLFLLVQKKYQNWERVLPKVFVDLRKH